jgi:hypothetical protein
LVILTNEVGEPMLTPTDLRELVEAYEELREAAKEVRVPGLIQFELRTSGGRYRYNYDLDCASNYDLNLSVYFPNI